MQPVKTDAARKSELAMIHVAKKSLALPDDEYRSILLSVTGKSSSAELDWRGRAALIAHFKKIGFAVQAKKAGRARPTAVPSTAALIRKIEAQLTTESRPWSYADALAKRICKVDRIEWCTAEHLLKIVAALSYDAKRRGMKAAAAPAV